MTGSSTAGGLLGQLLPPSVVPVEAFADVADEAPFAGEEDMVAAAVERRRREFITARRCAREALARLGYPPVRIPRGSSGEPGWPVGVVGSITHCTQYRGAAVARCADLASVGIDAEPHAPVPTGVLSRTADPVEHDQLLRLSSAQPDVHWDRLLFSAKEATYKAWHPLTRRRLRFTDVRLLFDPTTRSFTADLAVDCSRVDGGPPLTELRGRYLIARCLIVTAVTVTRHEF